MRKFFTLTALLFLAILSWGQAGQLNPQFGGGAVTTSFGSNHSEAEDLAVQSDGKVIAAGYALETGTSKFAMARYQVNGTLDNTFGTNGKLLVNQLAGCWLKSVILQPDGKILAGGSVSNGPNVQFSLMRLLANGSPDPAFGVNGIVNTTIGTYAYIKDIVLQPDGKIIVAGESFLNGEYDFTVARYESNGTLDPSFSGGYVVVDFNSDDYVKAVRLQPDGKILVAGSSNFRFAITRLHSTGAVDNNFGNEGFVLTTVGTIPGNDNALGMTLQPDGKILVVGQGFNPPYASDLAMVRYTSSGTPDPSFGNNGIVLTDLNGSFDEGSAVSLQSDGRILVAGNTNYMGQPRIALLRFHQQGTPDVTFGTSGQTVVAVGNEAYARAMYISGLSIYVAGVAKNNPDKFALLSFTNNAMPLPVRMLDFTAHKEGNNVVLKWTTEEEINTKSFTAEKSTDGRNFKAIETQDAAGNSSVLQHYSTIDRGPLASVNYYRIRTTDLDGSYSFSKIIAIKNEIRNIEVFPNPVQTVTQLQLPALTGAVRIDILDASGRLARTMRVTGGSAQSVAVDMSSMLKGMYVLQVTGEGLRYTQKLIKE